MPKTTKVPAPSPALPIWCSAALAIETSSDITPIRIIPFTS